MENESDLNWMFWLGTLFMAFMALSIVLLAVFYQRRFYIVKQHEAEVGLKATLEAEKTERNRISADLHDGISGDISAILNLVGVLEVKNKQLENVELLYEIKAALGATIDEVQRVSYNLMPPLLETEDLQAVLKDFFNRVEKTYKVKVEARYLVKGLLLTNSESYELYRCVQELTENALKHGKALNIKFSVDCVGEEYVFSFLDDGCCYDFYKVSKSAKGMGIRNIKARLSNLKTILIQVPSESGNCIFIRKKIRG